MKSILLLLLVPILFSSADACDLPAGYLNQASHTEGGLSYKFAVDRLGYTMDDTIKFYYLVENVGPDTVTFEFPVLEQHAFRVYPDTCHEFCQEGCLEDAVYYEPFTLHYAGSWFTLLPGECRIFQSAWHIGTKTTPGPDPQTGVYRVFGGLYNVYQSPCGESGNLIEPSELTLEIVIAEPVSTEDATWGGIKSKTGRED
jgi:hypothetical protein